jgi:hypothetical protein
MTMNVSVVAGLLAAMSAGIFPNDAMAGMQADCPYIQHYKEIDNRKDFLQLVKIVDKKTITVGDKAYRLKEESDRLQLRKDVMSCGVPASGVKDPTKRKVIKKWDKKSASAAPYVTTALSLVAKAHKKDRSVFIKRRDACTNDTIVKNCDVLKGYAETNDLPWSAEFKVEAAESLMNATSKMCEKQYTYKDFRTVTDLDQKIEAINALSAPLKPSKLYDSCRSTAGSLGKMSSRVATRQASLDEAAEAKRKYQAKCDKVGAMRSYDISRACGSVDNACAKKLIMFSVKCSGY